MWPLRGKRAEAPHSVTHQSDAWWGINDRRWAVLRNLILGRSGGDDYSEERMCREGQKNRVGGAHQYCSQLHLEPYTNPPSTFQSHTWPQDASERLGFAL